MSGEPGGRRAVGGEPVDPRALGGELPYDPQAMGRRVLLAGAVALGGFFVLGYLLTAVDAPPFLLLPAMLLLVLLVVRPLLTPVLAADRVRRRLARESFRAQRDRR